MKPSDFLSAALIGLGVLLGTLLFSIPMVAFYAYVIERGHSPEFYRQAAQWIAPWSSHVLGPLLFFWLNYRGAVRRPTRNATGFACLTIVGYAVIDLASVPLFGLALSTALTATFFISLTIKLMGALTGARFGASRRAAHLTTTPPKGA